MNWLPLTSSDQLEEIQNHSGPIIIFKHSTRCSVSRMAKRSVEFDAELLPDNVPAYFLDLIQYRDLSNLIAEKWNVRHESPQVLLIHNQKCIYHASHNEINLAKIVAELNQLNS